MIQEYLIRTPPWFVGSVNRHYGANMFLTFHDKTGILFEDRFGEWPSILSSWNEQTLVAESDGTHFGYVYSGEAMIRCDSGSFTISAGMYFSVPGSCVVQANGRGILMSRLNFHGFFQFGGPIEATGRLRYIDGCSDSLLISPVVCGDACLNLLHIPPGTRQTRHTHPSLRAGLIVSGEGTCETPEGSTQLRPGMVFVIPEECEHSFHTTNSELLVIAWHPDSDTGPKHDDHPMVNRTIVNGVAAAHIPEIRT